MRYMGGKHYQSRQIVDYLKSKFGNEEFEYYEPFCGACSVAVRVCKEMNPTKVTLTDANRSLILLWDKCMRCGVGWLPTDVDVVAAERLKYKRNQDMNDPLTTWYGICCSWYGRWFGPLDIRREVGGKEYNPYESQTRAIQKNYRFYRAGSVTYRLRVRTTRTQTLRVVPWCT